jgi:hypothetical protein
MADRDETRSEMTAAEQAMRSITEGLERIARERAKVRPEDWATLFRQLQAVLLQLSTHPFVKGDMQAELLVERILRSETLEQVDERTDDLAEYAMKKVEYIAALKAIAEGRPVEGRPGDGTRHIALRNTSSEVTRAAAAGGPSGDDFVVGGQDAAENRPRRSLLRL